jgi:hypothetical protein
MKNGREERIWCDVKYSSKGIKPDDKPITKLRIIINLG